MSKDLYDILGVARSASATEIKKAYRQLARKYHPDVNQKDPTAEAKFIEGQKAYAILSDSQKKAQYDQYGITDDTPGGGGAGGFGGFEGADFGQGFGGFSESIDDIFSSFFSGNTRRSGSRSRARRGEDLRYDLEITLEEAALGFSKEIEIFHLEKCSSCQGSGADKGTGKTTCAKCQGSGQVRVTQRTVFGNFSQVSTCPDCNGAGQTIKNPCRTCIGKGVEKKRKKVLLNIPAGVETGTKIRMSDEGNQGVNGGPRGDLYIFITVKQHKYFKREQSDLLLEIEIPFTKAILGTEIEIPTIDGKASLKVPSGTQPNTVFRLRNKGIPSLRGYGRGDQKVTVKVAIPKTLSSQEKNLVKEIAAARGELQKPQNILDYVKKFF